MKSTLVLIVSCVAIGLVFFSYIISQERGGEHTPEDATQLDVIDDVGQQSVAGIASTSPVENPPREMSPEDIAYWYGPLQPIMIGPLQLLASVADSLEERQKGLSGTPFLPTGVVKVFVFEKSDAWSFWMKDMKYDIDILWVNADGQIVYIAPNATPESYPQSYVPTSPALYVIETEAGYAAKNGISVGTQVSFNW